MEKILSYCLFEPKSLPQHRFWDKDKNNRQRYWFNLPSIALINSIIYPDYTMKVHTSKNVWENELSEVLNILSENIDNFKVETIDIDYNLTEPAIWRMMPLWLRDVEIFHTRDLDSVPGETEYKFVRFFEKSQCSLGTLRTHENHYGIKCRMLAGLSSFKSQEVPMYIRWQSFNLYYSQRHNQYGSDQDLMIQKFTADPEYTKDNFLDCRAYKQNKPQDFSCQNIDLSHLSEISVSPEKKKIFDFLKTKNLDNWAGEPVDCRGEYTNWLLKECGAKDIYPQLKKNVLLSGFYGIDTK